MIPGSHFTVSMGRVCGRQILSCERLTPGLYRSVQQTGARRLAKGAQGKTGPCWYSTNASRPQARVKAELPSVPNRKPIFLLAALIAVGSWSAFASYATNKERLSSSVFRSVQMQLKDSKEVQRALGGEPITLVPSTFGDPWISGSVNMMQGKVDVSFKIQGPKDVGTAYFTSIRRDQKRNFEVLRFLLVTDSGETVSLLSSAGASHDSDGELEQGPASS